MPDLPWTAANRAPGPGVVLETRLQLRRFRDVPALFRDSLAIRRQVMGAPGARSLVLRARPLARRFTTVSWWDDEVAIAAFVRAEPHRGAMRRWPGRLISFTTDTRPGRPGRVPVPG